MNETADAHPVDQQRIDAARARTPSAADAERMTALLSLLAEPVRTRLLHALDRTESMCAGDLALTLNVTEEQAGYGLQLLHSAGLVERRQSGRVALYRLPDGFPEPLRHHCLRQLVELSRGTTGDGDD
ncbi:metalloregulator ArsR/SmtB family transcription factor [Modestobacter marinus]|uniref:DNA-binding transcriptional ArsR family regulator n=1 Tax=Modestobacter marinus TaxID=477641 RepID=A0A846M417_9ACTN|nr:helix-turn-helix transcriptional regulator [Modestobacter marinus]NIH69240.1 DNA-binding transcriptional ArsR family regulator [Modestobacter marinus]GGL85331.1 transcriptional regulator [Modestobacter marinus]